MSNTRRWVIYKEKDPALLKMCERNWYVCPEPDDGSFELFDTHGEAIAHVEHLNGRVDD